MSVSPVITALAGNAAARAEKLEYEFTYSRFLSPAEQITFFREITDGMLRRRLFFFGGCTGCDRRRAVFIPSYTELTPIGTSANVFSPEREGELACLLRDLGENADISPVQVKGSSFCNLTHRDYMGSILGLGIDRAVIGDIAVTDEHSALVFADGKMAPYIAANLTKVARDTVKCSIAPVSADFVIPRKFQIIHENAGSDRADCIAAALAGLSRSEAKALCAAGHVELNYVSPVEADASVAPGDVFSVRGCGKFIIDSFDGATRSGRLKFTARKYL